MNLKLFILLFPIAFVLNKTVSILLTDLFIHCFIELFPKPVVLWIHHIFHTYYLQWILWLAISPFGRAGSNIYMRSTYIIICSAYIYDHTLGIYILIIFSITGSVHVVKFARSHRTVLPYRTRFSQQITHTSQSYNTAAC